MATLLEDTFTGGAGALSGHTPDSGGSAWVNGPGWGNIGSMLLDGAGVVSRAGGSSDAKAGGTSATTDGYFVVRTTTLVPPSGSPGLGIELGPAFNISDPFTAITLNLDYFSGTWHWSMACDADSSGFNAFVPASGDHDFQVVIATSGMTLTMDGAALGTLASADPLDMTGCGLIMRMTGGAAVTYLNYVEGPPPSGNASGFTETGFGTPTVLITQAASGFSGTSFGSPAALDIHRAASMGALARFGAPTTPTNRTQDASGWLSGEFGQAPTAIAWALDGSANLLERATFVDARAHFGTPVALSPFVADATGEAPATAFGTPAASQSERLDASALDPQTTFGEPTVRLGQRASGWRPAAFGTPTVRLTQAAASIGARTQFGSPAQWGPHMTTGRVSTHFGQPTALQRFNHPAQGFYGTNFGTPAALQRHRAAALPPSTQFGTPLLLRNPAC